MLVLEIANKVGRIIDEIGQEIEVPVLVFGNVLGEQAARHRPRFDHGLEHGQHIAAPLRFIGQQGPRSVQDARRHQPARARLEPVGLGVVENSVVAFVPSLKAGAHVLAGRTRFQSEIGMRKIAVGCVLLRRKIVAFRLALTTDKFGQLVTLVQVMHDGAHVVEELAVHRPAMVLLPNRFAHETRSLGFDGIFQGEPVPVREHIAQPLVGRAVVIHSRGGGSEPALVDAAAMGAVSVEIARVELEPAAGLRIDPRHPCGGKPENAFTGFNCLPG